VDSAINWGINSCSFELFALNRWLKIQEQLVGDYNLKISEELEELNKNNLTQLIELQKQFLRELFYFERFKVEFRGYHLTGDRLNFINLETTAGTPISVRVILFDSFEKNIALRMTDIDGMISAYTKHFDSVIALKNIEYNNNLQWWIRLLTILILILTLLQVITQPTILNVIKGMLGT
jgi:hypothetical protein